MLEKDIEKKLVRGVQDLDGLCLKWVSPGCTGVPDRIVILPGGRVYFVELKKPKGRLAFRQSYIHTQLLRRGVRVLVLWTPEDVDKFLREVTPGAI